MFLNAISPSRTPAKSLNVERLMSLQKSTKHLSDVDILSVAAEASAMKRQSKTVDNVRTSLHARYYVLLLFPLIIFSSHFFRMRTLSPTVNRSLFPDACLISVSQTIQISRHNHRDYLNYCKYNVVLGGCSKHVTGTYLSPEKAVSTTPGLAYGDSISEDTSDSDEDESQSENEQTDANVQAEKHFAQILQIVNKTSGIDKAIRSRAQHTAQENNAVEVHHSERQNDFSKSTYTANNPHSPGETDFGQDYADTAEDGVISSTLEGLSVSADVAGIVTASGIKDLVVHHILTILNTGTLEEVSTQL